MMPNGMFAREKCEPRGMLNQDRNEAMAEYSSFVNALGTSAWSVEGEGTVAQIGASRLAYQTRVVQLF
jgi:hypothetical protein